MEDPLCENQNDLDIAQTLRRVAFWVYCTNACVMTAVIVSLICKRGNLVAILSILVYTCAETLKMFLLSDYSTDISATATVSRIIHKSLIYICSGNLL